MGSETMEFTLSESIDGVVVRPLRRHEDHRGWLAELYRCDELDYRPAMCYLSLTYPGKARGPHEHVYQSDLFAFIEAGTFRVYLWDTRKESPTYLHRMRFEAGADNPLVVLVPPRVVHAYRCISSGPGIVINLPDRLYKGIGRSEEVDEIRHEESTGVSYFSLD
jgi:dTDP-4-dehydrorhamnose 3,5-epimerase